MSKRTVRDLDVRGKKVLVRVDFNVPLGPDGSVSDDRRIVASLPTLRHILDHGGAVIAVSHLGRPKGDPKKDAAFRMDRVAARLKEKLGSVDVLKADDVVGAGAQALARKLAPGQVLVLENVRFHSGEKDGDVEFAHQLRSLADAYVNDAFGTCHRRDASMVAVPQAVPVDQRAVGFLIEKELQILEQLLEKPGRPMIAVMGGAKVSDKIGFIEAILKRVDKLLVGGAITYTFRKALGQSVGKSLVEHDKLDLAKRLLDLAGDRLVLPADHLVADTLEPGATTKVVEKDIPDGWLGVDIGPKTIELYSTLIRGAKTVLWNGPMGKFEDEPFQRGTKAIAEAMANSHAVTVVGGGESAEAVEHFGLASRMTHVSTGGGAFLEFIEGKPFAALDVIPEA